MIKTVKDWYVSGDLNQAFATGFSAVEPFALINVPIRELTAIDKDSGEETVQYYIYNVGFSISDISNIYYTQYGRNFLISDTAENGYTLDLGLRINAVVTKNWYKYLKLIELMGYLYNPIWNVDGTELHGTADFVGDTDTLHNPAGEIKSTVKEDDHPVSKHFVNPYDDAPNPSTRLESMDETSGTTIQNYDDYSEISSTIHHTANNIINTGTTEEPVFKNQAFTIVSKDNVFRTVTNVTGPDRYFIEKNARQGNIGVTKTQELIAAERENLKFNLLQQFFNDINEQILIGLYKI